MPTRQEREFISRGAAPAEPNEKFPWGEVIRTINLDLDGEVVTIVKYHPWKSHKSTILVGDADLTKVLYHNDDISWSHSSIKESLIYWLTHASLGLNNHSLAAGICRALSLNTEEA